ncbi:hypothetical protein KFF05_02050 [bacterium SCSIO 12827]|nr:hypothetical protein KFF05_02050 [bacterium SCSIO 12827]
MTFPFRRAAITLAAAVALVSMLTPRAGLADAADHNAWTDAIKAQRGFKYFDYGFSPDSRHFVTLGDNTPNTTSKTKPPLALGRLFTSADGKAKGPAFETGMTRVDVAVPTNGGVLVALAGKSPENKLILQLFDGTTGTLRAEHVIADRLDSFFSHWRGLAVDGKGSLYACVKIVMSNNNTKAEDRLMRFSFPDLASQGDPFVLSKGDSHTTIMGRDKLTNRNIVQGVVNNACTKNSFQYSPARGELVYLIETKGNIQPRTQIMSIDPDSGKTTRHADLSLPWPTSYTEHEVKFLSAGRDLRYLYFSFERKQLPKLELRDVSGRVLASLGTLSTPFYLDGPNLITGMGGTVVQVADGKTAEVAFLPKVELDRDKEWIHDKTAKMAFDPDSRRVIRLNAGQWDASTPLTAEYLMAKKHWSAATELAEGGFPDLAAAEFEKTLNADPPSLLVNARRLVYYWEKHGIPADRIGKWVLTAIKADTPRAGDPRLAQAMLVFSLMASANGHPAIGLQAAEKVAALYIPKKESNAPFGAMYAALAKANALAANGDLQGGLAALVPHREVLQQSQVRKWFAWYPKLLAPLGRAQPRQMALILGQKESELPKFPAPGPAAAYVDLNGNPVGVTALAGSRPAAPAKPAVQPVKAQPVKAKPAGKVLD